MSDQNCINVGSRKSVLALTQTNHVIDKLKQLHTNKTFEIVSMNTTGDNVLDKALPKIGEKSLFTKELEIALADKSVDFVVHSLKDLPTDLPSGLILGAILEREDPRDALILNKKFEGKSLSTLPSGSIIGTSSLRRTAQLARKHPHLKVENIRGNLNTRLKKLDEANVYAGIILAVAGVKRMNWTDRISEYLEPSEMMYCVGQGALAVECRDDDSPILSLLSSLHHEPTVLRSIAERGFLNTLGGGCSAPVAVYSECDGNTIKLTGAVWSLDGKETIEECLTLSLTEEDESSNEEVDNGGGDRETNEEPARKMKHLGAESLFGIHPGCIKTISLKQARCAGVSLAKNLINKGALDIMASARKIVNETLPPS